MMLKCLWIARDIPFPLDAGDKVYSANLAKSLAESGATVRFLGFAPNVSAAADWPVESVAITSGKRSTRAGLASRYPLQAAVHDTSAYKHLLTEQLRENWDAIILDSYGSGWALEHVLDARRSAESRCPLLIYVAHNHETILWKGMVRNSSTGLVRRAAMWQNYIKIRALERKLVRSVDLVTAITDEDAAALGAYAGAAPSIVLTPGYSGAEAPFRLITDSTPRRVLVLGSFRWVVKQENLRAFISAADDRFHAHGIQLDIIGDVPEELVAQLRSKVRATVFHGFVADTRAFMAEARLAVVPEMIGGGFKIKFLDYIFGRVPVATLANAAAGLPAALRDHLITSPDMDRLVDDIVNHIDDAELLNKLQEGALQVAVRSFRWPDRGARMRSMLCTLGRPSDPARGTVGC